MSIVMPLLRCSMPSRLEKAGLALSMPIRSWLHVQNTKDYPLAHPYRPPHLGLFRALLPPRVLPQDHAIHQPLAWDILGLDPHSLFADLLLGLLNLSWISVIRPWKSAHRLSKKHRPRRARRFVRSRLSQSRGSLKCCSGNLQAATH